MSQYNADQHQRRSIRLQGYDYSQAGAYFVTICAFEQQCLFGNMIDGVIQLTAIGQVVQSVWEEIPHHFPNVALDAFVVMPNHVHGILFLTDAVRATHASPLQTIQSSKPCGPKRNSIGAIIGSFKSAATKRINQSRNAPGTPLWHRNYYEHIIPSERALQAIRQYITANPAKWHLDRYNAHAR
jgi:putative transposase